MVAVRSDKPALERQARMRDRLARRDHGELRHPVERRQLTLAEEFERVVVLDLGHDVLGQQIGRDGGGRRNAADAAGETRPMLLGSVADRRDNAPDR